MENYLHALWLSFSFNAFNHFVYIIKRWINKKKTENQTKQIINRRIKKSAGNVR